MPLLALPSEILDEILGYVATPPTNLELESGSLWAQPLEQSHLGLPNQDILSVAATSQLLRSLALKFIYSKLVASSRFSILHNHLRTYPHIAACTRELALWPTSYAYSPALQGILTSCTRLQDLRFEMGNDAGAGAGSHGGSVDVILGHLALESKKSLKSLRLGTNLVNLSKSCKWLLAETAEGNFGELREVRLAVKYNYQQEHFDSGTLKYLLEASGELDSAKMESVRALRLFLPFPYRLESEEPSVSGRYFAKLMPNIRVLSLKTNAECTYSMLSTYTELGSNLTELVLEGMRCDCSLIELTSESPNQKNRHPHHFCEIIPKLSRNLTKFCMSTVSHIIGHSFCHLVFGEATDWPKLVELDVTSQSTCAGVKLDLIHKTMTELTQIRPQASLRLVNSSMYGCSPDKELVCWNLKGGNYIATLEMFEELGPSNPRYGPHWPEIDSDMEFDDMEFDEFDDEHDYEHDLEDAMEDFSGDDCYDYYSDID